MESNARKRYKVALDELNAMRASTTPAEFSVAFLGFLTFSRSILDVARAEAARHGDRHPIKRVVESAEEEDLVKFFVSARNAALKENQYQGTRSVTIVEPQIAIRFRIGTTDVLVSPSRGIDESGEPRQDVVEIEMRERKAEGPAVVTQEFFFVTGKYKDHNVTDLSAQYLNRLETVVGRVEKSLGSEKKER